MARILISLILLISSISSVAQQNELPKIGLKRIGGYAFVEVGNNYFFNTLVFGRPIQSGSSVLAAAVNVKKVNKHSLTIVGDVQITGDTAQVDSSISPFQQVMITGNSRIYFAYQRLYPNSSSSQPHLVSSIVLAALDTNLSLQFPEKTIQSSYFPYTNRFVNGVLQSLTYANGRLIVGYYLSDRQFGGGATISRYMICDTLGVVLKDSIAGVIPSITTTNAVNHQLAEIVPGPNGGFWVTGSGVTGIPQQNGFVLTDRDGEPLDTFNLKPDPFGYGGMRGYYPQFPNFLSLPSGSIIIGRDYFVLNGSLPSGSVGTAIAKLSAASRYAIDTALIYFGKDAADLSYSSMPSLHNLDYNSFDNRVYYANANSISLFTPGRCSAPNHIQVISADTNLRRAWHKYLVPSTGSCAFVTRVAASNMRPGVDVVGHYTSVSNPTDTALQGSFIIHIDSTGALDASATQSFQLRERFVLYPNPASTFVMVDDLFNAIIAVEMFDIRGQLVQKVQPADNPVRVNLENHLPGSYLIRLRLNDGTTFSQKIQLR